MYDSTEFNFEAVVVANYYGSIEALDNHKNIIALLGAAFANGDVFSIHIQAKALNVTRKFCEFASNSPLAACHRTLNADGTCPVQEEHDKKALQPKLEV